MTSMLPSALDQERTAQLPGVRPSDEPPSPVPDDRAPLWRRALRFFKRAGRALVVRATAPVINPLDDRMDELIERIDTIQQMVDQVVVKSAALPAVPDALAVNQQLLKAEVRQVKDLLAMLGAAIAPAAGIEGVPARFSELRERVVGLDRRVRALVESGDARRVPAAEGESPSSIDDHPASSLTGSGGGRFDYAGFERRFRGDPADVVRVLDERYAALLSASPPVLDVGCGRAELIELLVARGVEASGIDLDANLVADARARGLDVRQADVVEHLRSLDEGSLGSIIATHVVEHLDLDVLLEFLELAASRLRPDGILVAETPNPATLVVLGNSYILDPTHVRPLHPSLLSFLCESAGFRHIDLQFFAPAEGYRLPLVEADDAPAWVEQVNFAFSRLNDVLFGSQEYAVIARTPPAG